MEFEYPDDWSDFDEGDIEFPYDSSVDEAKKAILILIEADKDNIYYIQQIEVFLEKAFFHWITARAITELLNEGSLRSEEVELLGATRVKFVFHKSNRFYKRQINNKIEIIRSYSIPEFSMACGRQAEILFFNALTNRGFFSHGQNTNVYNRKHWKKTDHNLDFIIERDNIVYGAEIKNKLSYIGKDELEIKLEMCEFLGVRPLFIMRAAPKTYNYTIINNQGFALIFETQIYPFGQKEMVERVKKGLSLPVDCPRAIPEGIIDRFEKWHNKQRA